MKFLSLIVAATLTGCAGFDASPIVDVANNALDEPTIKSGMTSRDAAYMASYKRYIDKVSADKPIVVIEGDGSEIKLSGVKSIKVYGPNTTTAAAPEQEKPLITQILDSATRLAERVLLPIYIVKEQSQTARIQGAYDKETEQIRSDERKEVTGQAIEAASKDPLVVMPVIVR
jgi:hypothetical protein